jgi:hypothetical protein
MITDDGLNVKRSSAVCALPARLPVVEVVSTPRSSYGYADNT